MDYLILILMFLMIFVLSYFAMYWLMIFLLAMINSNAIYDEISRKSILKLAKKDKVWKDVAEILNLERKGKKK